MREVPPGAKSHARCTPETGTNVMLTIYLISDLIAPFSRTLFANRLFCTAAQNSLLQMEITPSVDFFRKNNQHSGDQCQLEVSEKTFRIGEYDTCSIENIPQVLECSDISLTRSTGKQEVRCK
uniref:Putative ixodes 10 kDa peptide protein n=1 Tax=Ixodes ricinus TaxID=34613 RepID=A0A0K8RLI8_IXORI